MSCVAIRLSKANLIPRQLIDSRQLSIYIQVMITSTITKRGQTTLPREIQNALHLEAGQKLVYEILDGSVIIRPHPGVMASFGSLKRPGAPPVGSWKSARAKAREEWAEHAGVEGLPK
jgi:antitoxin PrlF